jgi:hypothetical protein
MTGVRGTPTERSRAGAKLNRPVRETRAKCNSSDKHNDRPRAQAAFSTSARAASDYISCRRFRVGVVGGHQLSSRCLAMRRFDMCSPKLQRGADLWQHLGVGMVLVSDARSDGRGDWLVLLSRVHVF